MTGPFLAAVLAASAPSEAALDNGLRVVLIPHRANPMVASAVVVGAGVVHEPAKAEGSSHLLEHLLFNGTTTRTQKELYDAVDRIGAYNNATTREDHTLFTLLVPSGHAEEGLAIQADMLFRSTIPAETFDKERKIVLEELARDASDPGYGSAESARRWLYAGTPIARPVLGTESSLASISRDTVVAYYRARYVPENMTLVVMGDFETSAMLEAVRRTFGAVRRGKAPAVTGGRWPDAGVDNVESVAATGDPEVRAAFPFEAHPWDRESRAAEILLAAASEGVDAPLRRALAQRGIEGEAELGLERRVRPWSTVVFRTASPTGDPAPALDAMAEAIRSTRAGGAARARLDRAVARAGADAAIARDQIHYFALLRSDRILRAPRGALAAEAELLRSLGPPDWDAAATMLERGLARARAWASSTGAPGRSTWRPAPPEAVTAADRGSVRAGALENGLRYIVRASDDSGVVAMHVLFAPRGAAEAAGLDGVTDLLHRAALRGTLVHPKGALAARLDDLGARLRAVDDPSVPFDDYYTTPEFSWIRLEAPAASWREAVSLVGEMVGFPDLTDDALEKARAEMLPLAERRAKSPREVAVGALDALLAPGHPLTRPPGGRPETLARITLETLRERHRSWAAGSGMVVSVVGPLDPEEAIAVLSSAFGRLPAGAPAPPSSPAAAAGGSSEVPLGAPQGYLALGAFLDVSPQDRAALTVAVAALSDRLAFELRETRGLAYSVGASLRPWGDRWRFQIDMGTRPDNLATAEEGIRSVLAGLRSDPPATEELSRVIQAVRGRALMRRMTRISLAYEAGMEALRGRPPGDELRALDALERVSVDDVRRVVERLDPGRLARVVVR